MRTAKIAIFRWALIGCLGLVPLLGLPAQQAQAAAPPERILPDTTVFLLKLNDAKSFREAFRGSQYGQLWNDPALKDFRDELGHKLAEATKDMKEKIGVSISDLLQLPQGSLAVAAIAKDAAREDGAASSLPVEVVLMADAGENEKKMLEVLERATKQGEAAGAKVSTESFNGLTIHIIQFPPREPKPKPSKEKPKPLPEAPADLDQFGKHVLRRHRSRASSRISSPIATAATTRWPRPRPTRRPRRRPIRANPSSSGISTSTSSSRS